MRVARITPHRRPRVNTYPSCLSLSCCTKVCFLSEGGVAVPAEGRWPSSKRAEARPGQEVAWQRRLHPWVVCWHTVGDHGAQQRKQTAITGFRSRNAKETASQKKIVPSWLAAAAAAAFSVTVVYSILPAADDPCPAMSTAGGGSTARTSNRQVKYPGGAGGIIPSQSAEGGGGRLQIEQTSTATMWYVQLYKTELAANTIILQDSSPFKIVPSSYIAVCQDTVHCCT